MDQITDFSAARAAFGAADIEQWLFKVACAGATAPDEEIEALIDESPDADHEMVRYLQAVIDGRASQRLIDQVAA
jgi:hypothetical protein